MIMTDNDIIKALECCLTLSVQVCPECTYYRKEHCSSTLIQDTIDLINRQKADIERLKYNLKAVLDERADYSEPVQEFIKRFEKKIKDVKFTIGQTWEIQSALKEVEKEMVGERDV